MTTNGVSENYRFILTVVEMRSPCSGCVQGWFFLEAPRKNLCHNLLLAPGCWQRSLMFLGWEFQSLPLSHTQQGLCPCMSMLLSIPKSPKSIDVGPVPIYCDLTINLLLWQRLFSKMPCLQEPLIWISVSFPGQYGNKFLFAHSK